MTRANRWLVKKSLTLSYQRLVRLKLKDTPSLLDLHHPSLGPGTGFTVLSLTRFICAKSIYSANLYVSSTIIGQPGFQQLVTW